MKIAIVSPFYSRGMGYTENLLPKALAKLGHEVHVLTSDLNVYGNEPGYDRTYKAFLGEAQQPAGSFDIDGYRVHRLTSGSLGGYVRIEGLGAAVRRLRPDIVHTTEVASLQTFELAALKPFSRFKLFTESHQHLSVVKPYIKEPNGHHLARAGYWLTRTAPTALASRAIELCYAIAPDCAYVAKRFYGVPTRKIRMQSLGTDTDLFRPAESTDEQARREAVRAEFGFAPGEVVCIYTGRFSTAKNPLVLARAIAQLAESNSRFRGLFVGEGEQRAEIEALPNCAVTPFVAHQRLAELYRAADIAVWPTQESMSMLDAAASGLPLVVSDKIGESERVAGNGGCYAEGDARSMAVKLAEIGDAETLRAFSLAGRDKMLAGFSWTNIARAIDRDYQTALAG